MSSAILITGGAGFIGANFLRALVGSSISNGSKKIIVLDALTYAGNLANIGDLIEAESIQFLHGDIRHPETVRDVFRQFDFQAIVHFAAESHVDRSIEAPRSFLETNVGGTLNLLQSAQNAWRNSVDDKMFLHISTDEVYGTLSSGDRAFNEDTSYAPNSPYAASKAAADHLVRAWHQTYEFPAITTNCSNNYGPWQFPEKLIPLMILNAVEEKELPVYGDGMHERDWLHVSDHCEALLLILEAGKIGSSYCIGTDSSQTNISLVYAVCDVVDDRLGRPPRASRRLIRHVADRPGHDRRYAVDSSKLRSELGWSPRHVLEKALPDVVDWYLDNMEWISEIRTGEYMQFIARQYGGVLK